MQEFGGAAQRHFADATLLHMHGRLPNADHLAGFATECGLKEILVSFLGAQRTGRRPVSVVNGKSVQHGHLPDLWNEVQTAMSGRVATSAFGALLVRANPFDTWSVDDRYGDGSAVDEQVLVARLDVTRQILNHLQQAKISGALG